MNADELNDIEVWDYWDYYAKQVLSGYFAESDEHGFENYNDRNMYEQAVDRFGLIDAIILIEFNKSAGKDFTLKNLQHVYDWEKWRIDKE